MQVSSTLAKVTIVIGLLLISIVFLYFISPIPQWNSYHQFADSRALFFINNFGDVASNVGFFAVGFYGLVTVFNKENFTEKIDIIPYGIFFISIIGVGFGSAYYHWNPTTETLFWDRLPMSIAFMSFFAAVICDRIDKQYGTFVVLPILILAGILSLIYWRYTEMIGQGDLRPYGLIQYFPLFAIPVILVLFRRYNFTSPKYILYALVWYICAKLFEYLDVVIFKLLGNFVSGHTLKHLAAMFAVMCIIRMLNNASGKT